MNENMQYEVGDTITYIAFGERRTGVVTYKTRSIKNGEPGFEIPGFWGYDSQIVAVSRAGGQN